MTPERWQEVERLYNSAVDLPIDDRATFLRRACAGDDALREEVESLLAQPKNDDEMLGKSAVAKMAARILGRHDRPSLLGTKLGCYQVVSLLGQGGMGEVYQARDTRLNRAVAIKVLPPHLADEPEFHQRFEREARIIASLNHPHICTLHDIGQQDGIDFLVMEFLEGGTLAQLLAAGPLPLENALRYAEEIASALAKAHGEGVIHRDIKPANIFITRGGQAKLLDFGVAKVRSLIGEVTTQYSAASAALTSPGSLIGTAAYMSPEQANSSEVDARTDLFSLGAVLYEMVTGTARFQGETAAEPPRLRPDLPEDVAQIITRALTADIRRRYQSSSEMARDLSSARAAETDRASTDRPVWLKIVALILAAVGVALVSVSIYRRFRGHVEPAALVPVPFTAYEGSETSPTFSPDGTKIAFAWDGNPLPGSTGFDLYVKSIGSENLLRLTRHPSEWIAPAWSPDGTQIAFHRMAGSDTGIYVVSALGGPERKLRSTRVPYSVATPISWGPYGREISFGDPLPDKPEDRMFLLSVDTLETRAIPHDPKCLHEGEARFSHAGDQLAYVCVHSTDEFAVYSRRRTSSAPGSPFLGDDPKLIASFSNFVMGLAWSADDRKLVIAASSEAGAALNEVTLVTGSLRPLDFASEASYPALSPRGDKLAYSASYTNINIWRQDLLHPSLPAMKLISSTRHQDDGQYSPDGSHIVFQSDRGGASEIWMSDAEGGNLIQLSKFKAYSGSPVWSPDGKKIAFDSRADGHFAIYVEDISERVPRKLVLNLREDVSSPEWSHDGKWIYFRSHETVGRRIYRCAPTGGEATLISVQRDATSPKESPDGNFLYFANREANTGLTIISLQHDFIASAVDGLPSLSDGTRWSLVLAGIYFVPAESPRSVRFFDFSSRETTEIFHREKDFYDGFSISPDGRWLLFSQMDEQNSDIMLVNDFKY